ncbi:MAG TPA: hypothetical protein VHB98_18570 [Chloroflexota bacterium]|nr:hypothetical protein [Chloroflexota bacterium]
MKRISIAAAVAAVAVIAAGAETAAHLGSSGPVLRTSAIGVEPVSVAVDVHTGRVFVANRNTGGSGSRFGGYSLSHGTYASSTGTVSVLDARTGVVLHTVPVGPDPRAVAVDEAHGQVLVANDDDSSIDLLDPSNGSVIRSLGGGANPHGVAVDRKDGHDFVLSAGDGTVRMLDARTARLLHVAHLSGMRLANSFSLSIIAADEHDGRVYVGTPAAIEVLDARTGAMLRTTAVDSGVVSLAVDQQTGHLFVLGPSTLQEFDGRTNSLLRRMPIGFHATALAVDPGTHRLFVTTTTTTSDTSASTESGRLLVLDERTGALLKTIAVGPDPVAIALDPVDHRAYVVNAGGQVHTNVAWSWVPGWLQHWASFLPKPGTQVQQGSVTVINTTQL